MNIVICGSVNYQDTLVKDAKDAIWSVLSEYKLSNTHEDINNTVYFCQDYATSVERPKQEKINKRIDRADWVIVLFPAERLGSITVDELLRAVDGYGKRGYPVVSIMRSVSHKPDNMYATENSYSEEQVLSKLRERQNAESVSYYKVYDETSKEADLKGTVMSEMKMLLRDQCFHSQHLDALMKCGKNVTPQELYFSRERTSRENGFSEDIYFARQEVDRRFSELESLGWKYIIITGMPGSGKTRALYQALASPLDDGMSDTIHVGNIKTGCLSEKNIIVLTRENINDVFLRLTFYNKVKQHQEDTSNARMKPCIIVCDQPNDVFRYINSGDRSENIRTFFRIMDENPELRFFATMIPAALESFRSNWKQEERALNDGEKTACIDIPPVRESDDLADWLQRIYSSKKRGAVIGDFIPGLNNYAQDIITKIRKEVEDNAKISCYISELLKAVQACEQFRHHRALFLPVMIVEKMMSSAVSQNNDEFYRRMTEAINILTVNNVMTILEGTGRKHNIKKSDFGLVRENSFDEEDYTFNGEVYEDAILPVSYSYSLNEYVWNYLLESDTESQLIFYMNEERSANACTMNFFNTFSSNFKYATLGRIISRLPHTNCYGVLMPRILRKAYNEIMRDGKDVNSDVSGKDMPEIIALYIGRADSVDEVKDMISIVVDRKLDYTARLIGELYKFLALHPNEELLGEARRLENNVVPTFYMLEQKSSYYKYSLTECLDLLSEAEEKNIDLEEQLDRFLASVLHSIRCMKEDVFAVLSFCKEKNLQISARMVTALFAQNVLNCRERKRFVEYLLPGGWYADLFSASKYNHLLLQAIYHSYTFEESIYFLNLAKDFNEKAFPQKMLTVAFKLVQNRKEFNAAYHFVKEIEAGYPGSTNIIVYNSLLSNAPSVNEAINVVGKISQPLDEYTVNAVLKVVDSHQKCNKLDSAQDVLTYIYFSPFRMKPSVIGFLYKMALTADDEKLIRDNYDDDSSDWRKFNKIVNSSAVIVSTRIQKAYIDTEKKFEILGEWRELHASYRSCDPYISLLKLLGAKKIDKSYRDRMADIVNDDICYINRTPMFIFTLFLNLPEAFPLFDQESGEVSREFMGMMQTVNYPDAESLTFLFTRFCTKYADYGKYSKIYEFRKLYDFLHDIYSWIPGLWKNINTEELFPSLMWHAKQDEDVEWVIRTIPENLKFMELSKATIDDIVKHFKLPSNKDSYVTYRSSYYVGKVMAHLGYLLAESKERKKDLNKIRDIIEKNNLGRYLDVCVFMLKIEDNIDSINKWWRIITDNERLKKQLEQTPYQSELLAIELNVYSFNRTICRNCFDMWVNANNEWGDDAYETVAKYLQREMFHYCFHKDRQTDRELTLTYIKKCFDIMDDHGWKGYELKTKNGACNDKIITLEEFRELLKNKGV